MGSSAKSVLSVSAGDICSGSGLGVHCPVIARNRSFTGDATSRAWMHQVTARCQPFRQPPFPLQRKRGHLHAHARALAAAPVRSLSPARAAAASEIRAPCGDDDDECETAPAVVDAPRAAPGRQRKRRSQNAIEVPRGACASKHGTGPNTLYGTANNTSKTSCWLFLIGGHRTFDLVQPPLTSRLDGLWSVAGRTFLSDLLLEKKWQGLKVIFFIISQHSCSGWF